MQPNSRSPKTAEEFWDLNNVIPTNLSKAIVTRTKS